MNETQKDSLYNYETKFCIYEYKLWCMRPTERKCSDCIENDDGTFSCGAKLGERYNKEK